MLPEYLEYMTNIAYTLITKYSATLGVIASFIAILGFAWSISRKSMKALKRLKPSAPLMQRLLELVWDYPLSGENAESWAVKESLVLRGELDRAKEEPGLGIALVTTEFAKAVFGDASRERIELVVRWSLSRIEQKSPHYILVEKREPITGQITKIPDFRHSLAFGIILLRHESHKYYVDTYINNLLKLKKEDGCWTPSKDIEQCDVTTASYAVTLLNEYISRYEKDNEIIERCKKSLFKGMKWLIDNRNNQYLWSAGILREGVDGIITTALSLYLLYPLYNFDKIAWKENCNETIKNMIIIAMSDDTWRNIPQDQRMIMEARVAATIARYYHHISSFNDIKDLADLYLTNWKQRTGAWLEKNIESIDLSTATFILIAMLKRDDLVRYAEKILCKQRGISSILRIPCIMLFLKKYSSPFNNRRVVSPAPRGRQQISKLLHRS